MTESEDLARRMVRAFPVLQPVLEAHLGDQEGELLPYLLLADVARWAEAAVTTQPQAVHALVDWLDLEFNSAQSPERDLIALGFVEGLPVAPSGDPILRLLGPELHHVAGELGLLTPSPE